MGQVRLVFQVKTIPDARGEVLAYIQPFDPGVRSTKRRWDNTIMHNPDAG